MVRLWDLTVDHCHVACRLYQGLHEACVPLHSLPAALSLVSFGSLPSLDGRYLLFRHSAQVLLSLEALSHHRTSFSFTLLLLSLPTCPPSSF